MSWERIVGANIRRLRKARGLTQEALAIDAGLAMRHLGRIERGEGSPTLKTMVQLSEVLGVHLTALFAE